MELPNILQIIHRGIDGEIQPVLEFLKRTREDDNSRTIIQALFLYMEKDEDVALFYDIEEALYNIVDESSIDDFLQGLRGQSADIRILSLKLLRYLDVRHAASEIIPLLKDPDFLVRAEAADTLGYLKSREAVPHLIRCLNDVSYDVIGFAAFSLGHIGSKAAIGPLRKALDCLERVYYPGDSLFARINIWAALCLLGERERFSLLVNALKLNRIIPAAPLLSFIAGNGSPAWKSIVLREMKNLFKRLDSNRKGEIQVLEREIRYIHQCMFDIGESMPGT